MPSFNRDDYSDPQHLQFIEDMESAGYELRHYDGRFFYSGPAVEVEPYELQDVIRATGIRLQWDSMGLNIILYPPNARKKAAAA